MKAKQMKYLFMFYFIYYISSGVFYPFVNVHYERLGFTGSEIGLIGSIGLLAAMVITPMWGVLADRTRRYKTLLALVMICASISGFIWNLQTVFLNVLLSATCITVFRSAINPLADSLSVSYCSSQRFDFGKIRGIGSLGYVVGSFIIANVASYFGIEGPYMQVMCITLLVAAGFLLLYPQIHMNESREKSSILKNGKVLLKNKSYVFIVILMLFTNLAMDSAGGYVGNHLVNALGANDGAIGTYTLVAAFPEVFFIMIIGNIISRYGFKPMYVTAIACQCIRLLGYAFVDSVSLFYMFTIVHMLMTGVGAVANMNYIHKVVDTSMLTTAVSLYTGIYLVGQALYTQIFGVVYQLYGSHMIFLVTAAMSFIGLAMVLKTSKFNFSQE